MPIARPLIFYPYLAPRLTYRMIDTLLPRNAPVGIYASVCLRYLLLIHKGLLHPKVHHVRSYNFLCRLMRPYVLPQVLHGLLLISFAHANARPGLRHHGGAHSHAH